MYWLYNNAVKPTNCEAPCSSCTDQALQLIVYEQLLFITI